MKKLSIIFFAASLLLTSGADKAIAGGAGGQATLSYQIIQNGQLIPINISDAMTAIATQAQQYFTVILGPIANSLISNTLRTTSENTIAWANGGFDGTAPSLIQNPEDYIRNARINEVRKALSSLPEAGGVSDGIFSALSGSFRYEDKTLEDKMREVSSSRIPSIVQSEVCKEKTLLSLAEERAGSSDIALVNTEKQLLYAYACQCDPVNDASCATKLNDLYAQRPSLGGGAAWLALTGGDNPSTKVLEASYLVNKQASEAQRLAENELYFGLGAVSETKCLDPRTDSLGKTYCNKSAVVNPGKAVQSAIELAVNSGTLRLTNIQGEGTLGQILSSLTSQVFSKGLNQGLAALSGSDNTSVTVAQLTPIRNDLTEDPERKAELIRSIGGDFKATRETLTNVENVDRDYLRAIQAYNSKVNPVKACFDSLLERGMVSSSDSRAVAAYNYHRDRRSKIDPIQATIDSDLAKIAQGRELISTTENKINASNSSEEISRLFNAYKQTYTDQNIPSYSTLSERKVSYNEDKRNSESDNEHVGHINSCNQIEQSYNTDNNQNNFGGNDSR